MKDEDRLRAVTRRIVLLQAIAQLQFLPISCNTSRDAQALLVVARQADLPVAGDLPDRVLLRRRDAVPELDVGIDGRINAKCWVGGPVDPTLGTCIWQDEPEIRVVFNVGALQVVTVPELEHGPRFVAPSVHALGRCAFPLQVVSLVVFVELDCGCDCCRGGGRCGDRCSSGRRRSGCAASGSGGCGRSADGVSRGCSCRGRLRGSRGCSYRNSLCGSRGRCACGSFRRCNRQSSCGSLSGSHCPRFRVVWHIVVDEKSVPVLAFPKLDLDAIRDGGGATVGVNGDASLGAAAALMADAAVAGDVPEDVVLWIGVAIPELQGAIGRRVQTQGGIWDPLDPACGVSGWDQEVEIVNT
mmetsp:Transcript_41219/g.103500  ORF Transcript_41219/g.103500 Transcript_41219/m.103500 type:complete len:356 (-) Transcript_41219:302-1369(-)